MDSFSFHILKYRISNSRLHTALFGKIDKHFLINFRKSRSSSDDVPLNPYTGTVPIDFKFKLEEFMSRIYKVEWTIRNFIGYLTLNLLRRCPCSHISC